MKLGQLETKFLPVGRNTATNQEVEFALKHFFRHVHLLGPPGSGKTRLLLHLFQSLAKIPNASIILLNAKGSLAKMALDWALSHGLSKRIVWFDPGDPDHVVGYNPMEPTHLPAFTHAKQVREGVRAAWGQSSFEDTPQLARLLLYALAAALCFNLGLPEALQLLYPGSPLRKKLLPRIPDPQLRQAFSYFDGLQDRRQEELAASSLARLEGFLLDPAIRRILTARPSFQMTNVIGDHKILIANLHIKQPLAIDDVRLLGKFLINDVVNCVFARPPQERGPVFLIIDECQNFITADLASALAMGRELGLGCILAHQDLGQLRNEDPSQDLLHSVLGCARTRIVFGGCDPHDLEHLSKSLFLDQWDPTAVKFTSLELDPTETTRDVPSVTVSDGQTEGNSRQLATGDGRGVSLQQGSSVQDGTGTQRGRNSQRSIGFDRGLTQIEGAADMEGDSVGSGAGTGVVDYMLPDGTPVSSNTLSDASSDTRTHAHTRHHAKGRSQILKVNMTHGEQEAETHQHTEGRQNMLGVQFNESETETEGQHHDRSHTRSTGVSRVPFLSYEKRRVPTAYWSADEFLTMKLKQILIQPDRHFFLKATDSAGRFMKCPDVPEPWISARALAEGMRTITSQPFYSPIAQGAGQHQVLNGAATLVNSAASASPLIQCEEQTNPTEEDQEEDFFGPELKLQSRSNRKK